MQTLSIINQMIGIDDGLSTISNHKKPAESSSSNRIAAPSSTSLFAGLAILIIVLIVILIGYMIKRFQRRAAFARNSHVADNPFEWTTIPDDEE